LAAKFTCLFLVNQFDFNQKQNRMKSSRSLLHTLFLLCFYLHSFSQFTITPNVGANGVINTVGGSGILVSNVSIQCNANSYGSFANGNSAGLGLTTGLLLSTGLTSQINAPGNNQNDDFDFAVGTTTNDPQLIGLIGTGISIYDPCIIEFDIVPQCGTITITFVFGSDEYTNWVSQGFNDGFGFFVSGQNPAGGMYNNTNVAVLPSGTVVSIDNVNSLSNPTYFTNNNNGAAANHMDGFTKVITPVINVVPCQTYHFKLAIADAGDSQVDSAVLIDIIQCSNPLTLSTASTPDNCGLGTGTATLTPSGGIGPLTYSWSPSGGNGLVASNLIAGTYTVTVDDTLSCTTPLTSTVVVGSTGTSSSVVVPADITVCNGQTVAANSFTSPTVGATFSWVNSQPSIGLSATGTGNQPSFTAVNTGTTPLISTVTVTPAFGSGCPGISSSYTITVMPTPVMNPLANIAVCDGATLPASVFSSSVNNTTFNWTNTNTAIGLGSSGNSNVPSFVATNTSSNPLNATLNVIPNINNICYGVPVSYTITVNPTPILSPLSNVAVCTGQLVPASTFSTTPAGAIIDWTNSNTVIGLAASGTGNYGSFTGLNPDTTPVFSTLSAVPTFNGCSGPVVLCTLTILQKPEMIPPSNATVCAGTIIPLSDFDSNSGISFAWTNSNTAIGLGAGGVGEVPNFVTVNPGTSPLTALIDITPSLGTCIGDVVSYSITVLPKPTMAPVPSISVCANEQVVLSPFGGTPSGCTFQWSNDNTSIGLPAVGSNDIPTFIGITAGPYPTSGTISVQPELAGCLGDNLTFTINVNPIPVAATVSDISECANVLLSAIPFSSLPTGASFAWTNSNPAIGLTSSGNGSIAPFAGINVTAITEMSIVQVVPLLNNCSGNPIDFSITIYPIPVITASNDGPVCEGMPINLSVTNVSGASYAWSNSSSYSSSQQNPSLNPTTMADNDIYTVLVTANGCSNTASTPVVIDPQLLSTINPAGPFCADAPALGLISPFPGGTWSGSGVSSTGLFDPALASLGFNSIAYTTTGNCSTSTTTVIEVIEIPNVQFLVDKSDGCVPLTVIFTDATTPPGGSVVWNFGDGSLSVASPSTTHTFTSVGCFDISLESTANGCSNTFTKNDFICTAPNAIASFSANPSTTSILDPTIHFTNNSTDASNYSWDFGDNTQSTANHPAHTYAPNPSTYQVMLIANNTSGCSDTAYQEVILKDLLIYYVPNSFTPDLDDFNPVFKPIITSGIEGNHYQLLIFDRWGELVYQTQNSNEGWDGTYKNKPAKDDVYTWKIIFLESDTFLKREIVGHLNLLR
jgi:gliding motility-associated-like protein